MEYNEKSLKADSCNQFPLSFSPQHQSNQPGAEYLMNPKPTAECCRNRYKRLEGKTALITGRDSSIGRAVAYSFVREGADTAIVYYDEETDAWETARHIKELGGKCLLIKGDLNDPAFAVKCVKETVNCFGKLDVLVNNHAV